MQNLQKIMMPKGILYIYDFWITDQMVGNEAYTRWWHEEYLPRFPKPARDEHKWTPEEVKACGFSMITQADFEIQYTFTFDAFIRFMLIQSNINAKIKEKGHGPETIEHWFADTLTPIFSEKKQMLIFKGYRWYMKRID